MDLAPSYAMHRIRSSLKKMEAACPPYEPGLPAYLYGSATGVWAVDWTRVWGVILFNTLVVTGVFEKFRRNVEEKEIVR